MSQTPIHIYPSLLAADFGHLSKEAARIERAGADAIHLDIMDGHFVPNLTFGPKVVAAINRTTDLFLDVHLMIYNPFDYIEPFVEAGADRITFHLEATEDVSTTLKYIRKCGVEAGLAFRPETTPSVIPKYLDQCDLILLMTVNPGFGGQSFMPEVLDKIRFVREQQYRSPFPIQVDGGITPSTAQQCVAAGANVLVSGSYLFQQPDLKAAIQMLRTSSNRG